MIKDFINAMQKKEIFYGNDKVYFFPGQKEYLLIKEKTEKKNEEILAHLSYDEIEIRFNTYDEQRFEVQGENGKSFCLSTRKSPLSQKEKQEDHKSAKDSSDKEKDTIKEQENKDKKVYPAEKETEGKREDRKGAEKEAASASSYRVKGTVPIENGSSPAAYKGSKEKPAESYSTGTREGGYDPISIPNIPPTGTRMDCDNGKHPFLKMCNACSKSDCENRISTAMG